MDLPDTVRAELRCLVRDLAAGRYDDIVATGRGGRLTAAELKQAVTRYHVHLADLPDQAFELAHVYQIGGQPVYAVDLPLWTVEEGQSDLTLQVTVTFTTDRAVVSIDDLHVM